MRLEPMTPPELPVLTPRVPEPPVEVAFASRLTEHNRVVSLHPKLQQALGMPERVRLVRVWPKPEKK